MATQTPPENSTINSCDYFDLLSNPDGTLTLTRHNIMPSVPPTEDSDLILTKDIALNEANNTWIRIFRHQKLPSSPQKLPIIIYFHGGGFIICGAAWKIFHDFCASMASELPALIISVEYRLAPENRLPAAYEDAIEAVNWVRVQSLLGPDNGEKWLIDLGDFNRCFLMGNSAGGNIAYHAGIRALAAMENVPPVKISGLILHQPYFGGLKRTETEKDLVNDKILPLSMNDLMWELGLPLGVDRDHEYCNPTVDGEEVNRVARIGLKKMDRGCLVTVNKGDPLSDRQIGFVKMLETHGVSVVARVKEGGYHGIDLFEPDQAQALIKDIQDFIFSNVSS